MSAQAKRQHLFENNLPSQMLALEPRYLFDAAAVTTVADVSGAPTTGTADPVQADTAAIITDDVIPASGIADINDQGFFFDENRSDIDGSNFVGQISPAPSGVTFTLVDGQDSDTFAVSASGTITVKDNTKLDYENNLLPPLPTVEIAGQQVPYLSFQVQADDGESDPVTITIFMVLQDINDAPEAATPDDTTIALGEAAEVQVVATDEDIFGDSNNDLPEWSVVTYELENAPAGASIDANGLFSWTPTTAGTTTITVLVSNAGDMEQIVEFDVTAVPVVSIEGADTNMEDTTVSEGDAALFTVKLSGPSDQPVTVNLSATDITAESPPDYNSIQFYRDASGENLIPGNVLTFEAGVTAIDIYVGTETDLMIEPDETFLMTATAATGAVGSDTATGIIKDTTISAINEATQITTEKSPTEPGEENTEEGATEDGATETAPGETGPVDTGEETTDGEITEIGDEVEALLAEVDFSETTEGPAAGKPDSQQPQTGAEKVAEIMSIMDRAIAIATCREIPPGPPL